jgi:predicted TIM-barrel fold metal-dependent hydrolase
VQGKIALEEHFAIPETLEDSHGYFPDRVWQEVKHRVMDIQDRRIAEMDRHGIEMMLLSLNAPAVQGIPDPAQAGDIARKSNDFLAEQVHKRPDRFQGLAALAMQDPDGATRELERCVKELGFRGALVNGFSQVGNAETTVYYDLPQYRPFWAMAEKLDVPFYLHPRNPLPRDAKIYDGHPWLLGPIWAFGHETGVDNANAWIENRHSWPAKKRLSDYFRENFYVTTSGNFHTPALYNTMLEIGADRIMFSTDWPFENIDHAANWFDACPISENDRLKIGRENARRLFRLSN